MNRLPSEICLHIASFLENRDIVESSIINKRLYLDLKEQLKKREVIHLFLDECPYRETLFFTLSKAKRTPVYQQKIHNFTAKEQNEIRSFFTNLRVIFRLISEMSITCLELCPRTIYGEVPIFELYEDCHIRYAVYENVIESLVENKTLKKVNLSFFAEYLRGGKENTERRLQLQSRLLGHTSLERICASHPTATTFYSQPPVNLIFQKGIWIWTFD
jgi:hypothetical protein